jgi:peptide/nickel transport system ATP-binding protein
MAETVHADAKHAMQPPLLDVRGLSLEFRTRSGIVRALDHIDLTIAKGETVGVVGESGSGKSVLAYALLGISDPAARITAGAATFGGMPLTGASRSALDALRGREIAMIFQSPRTALNPIRKVGAQIIDVLKRHAAVRAADLRARAIDALRQVNIADPERRMDAYPFEMSGGMCQRVMIALAIACRPALLIADEPTTGLDVTTQANVMDLVLELARERNMATLLITHDLALAADYCHRIVVMHAGHVVETAPSAELFASPRHPYTRRLLQATPTRAITRIDELGTIPGTLPDLRRADLPACRYADRCERADERCRSDPTPVVVTGAHSVMCWHPYDEVRAEGALLGAA